MLCPRCGTSVGDTIGLCERCAAEAAAARAAEEKPTKGKGKQEATIPVIQMVPEQDDKSQETEANDITGSSAQNNSDVEHREQAVPIEGIPIEKLLIGGAGVLFFLMFVTAIILLFRGNSTTPVAPRGIVTAPVQVNVPKEPESLEVPEPESTKVTLQPDQKENDNRSEESDTISTLRKTLKESKGGIVGFASTTDGEVRFEDQIGFYYPRYGRIEVGFYTEKLSEQRRTQIRSSKSFRAPANDRRPVLILNILLEDADGPVKVANIKEYSVQFFREFGAFSFPGMDPSVTLRRFQADILSGEIKDLSGSLSDGGKFHGSVVGTSEHARKRTTFTWALQIGVSLSSIR